jgi:bifunctional non-homologous end joining protein LigD
MVGGQWSRWTVGLRCETRRGRDVTASLPELAPLADTLAGRSVVLDGELVTCTAGAVDFYRLAGRMAGTGRTALRAAAASPVTFVIFDFLQLDGVDLTGQPLLMRKQALDGLGLVGPAWVVHSWYPGTASIYSPHAWNRATRVW